MPLIPQPTTGRQGRRARNSRGTRYTIYKCVGQAQRFPVFTPGFIYLNDTVRLSCLYANNLLPVFVPIIRFILVLQTSFANCQVNSAFERTSFRAPCSSETQVMKSFSVKLCCRLTLRTKLVNTFFRQEHTVPRANQVFLVFLPQSSL